MKHDQSEGSEITTLSKAFTTQVSDDGLLWESKFRPTDEIGAMKNHAEALKKSKYVRTKYVEIAEKITYIYSPPPDGTFDNWYSESATVVVNRIFPQGNDDLHSLSALGELL